MMPRYLAKHFLIAAKHLHDDNFFRSVVLMIDHNPTGAYGLIINHPSPVMVSDFLEGHFEIPDIPDVIYTGGPVEPGALFILHDSQLFEGDEPALIPGLYVGDSAHTFEEVVTSLASNHDSLKFRIIAGYAGWSASQLESEIARGDWLVAPASSDMIFHDDPYSVWERLCRQLGEQNDFLPTQPNNPELN